MIVSNLIGGLGNQMFQYAAGRALSLKAGKPFKQDIADFAGYHLHQGFELARIFNCPINIATPSEVGSILGWRGSHWARRLLLRPSMAAFRPSGYVVEPHFQYWPDLLDIKNDCYLSGYWQSERYFSDFSELIRSDFTFSLELNPDNCFMAEKITASNSVGLHVRRGDYATNPTNLVNHGLCSIDYYLRAVRYIAERINNPVFFVFSDDVDWVKQNLRIEFPIVYVENNRGGQNYIDMQLMSLCRHNVIANSSFSWWGAWLNSSPKKIVISPKQWFVNGKNTKDLFPKSWVVL